MRRLRPSPPLAGKGGAHRATRDASRVRGICLARPLTYPRSASPPLGHPLPAQRGKEKRGRRAPAHSSDLLKTGACLAKAPPPLLFGRRGVRPLLIPLTAPDRGERSAERRGGLRDPLGGWRSRPARLRGAPLPPCDRRKGASRRSTGGVFLTAPGRAFASGSRHLSRSGESGEPALRQPAPGGGP